jgi:hypothetical protein
LGLLAKFAFGNMRQTVSIAGSRVAQSTVPPFDSSTEQSGLLAQSSDPTFNYRGNIGEYVRDEFAFMEDVGVELAYYPTPRLKLLVGYSLMYWSSVVRPADQIDFSLDGRLVGGNPPIPAPPAHHPELAFDATGFYIHGLNLGAEYRF